jgi:hypothetical protein
MQAVRDNNAKLLMAAFRHLTVHRVFEDESSSISSKKENIYGQRLNNLTAPSPAPGGVQP